MGFKLWMGSGGETSVTKTPAAAVGPPSSAPPALVRHSDPRRNGSAPRHLGEGASEPKQASLPPFYISHAWPLGPSHAFFRSIKGPRPDALATRWCQLADGRPRLDIRSRRRVDCRSNSGHAKVLTRRSTPAARSRLQRSASTVPTDLDKEQGRIVNNESSKIIAECFNSGLHDIRR